MGGAVNRAFGEEGELVSTGRQSSHETGQLRSRHRAKAGDHLPWLLGDSRDTEQRSSLRPQDQELRLAWKESKQEDTLVPRGVPPSTTCVSDMACVSLFFYVAGFSNISAAMLTRNSLDNGTTICPN